MRLPDIPQSWKNEIARDPNSEFSKKALKVQARIREVNHDHDKEAQKGAVSRIGTRLAAKFAANVGAIPCGPCKREINSLNHMTIEQASRQKEQIVNRIENNAATSNQAWYLKLTHKADQLITGGAVSRWYIAKLFDEVLLEEELGYNLEETACEVHVVPEKEKQ